MLEERRRADAMHQKEKNKRAEKESRENLRKLMKSRGIEMMESSEEEEESNNQNPDPLTVSRLYSPRSGNLINSNPNASTVDKGQEHFGRELLMKIKLRSSCNSSSPDLTSSKKNNPIPTSMQLIGYSPELKQSLKTLTTAENIEGYEKEIIEEFIPSFGQELSSFVSKLRFEKYGLKSN